MNQVECVIADDADDFPLEPSPLSLRYPEARAIWDAGFAACGLVPRPACPWGRPRSRPGQALLEEPDERVAEWCSGWDAADRCRVCFVAGYMAAASNDPAPCPYADDEDRAAWIEGQREYVRLERLRGLH